MTWIELSFSGLPQISTEYREPGNRFTILAKDSRHDKYVKLPTPSWEPEQSTKGRNERVIEAPSLQGAQLQLITTQGRIPILQKRRWEKKYRVSEVHTGDCSVLSSQREALNT